MAAKKTPNKGGRPAVAIDLSVVENLGRLQCTDDEIAAWFGVSRQTIANRKKDEAFREALERGKLKGCISVRRAQMAAMEAGNPTMLIWLGKQLLGQKDKVEQEVTGKDGAALFPAIQVSFVDPQSDG